MRGTGVALVTPFKKDLSIDFDALAKIVAHCISGGVEYLVALGTTGESVTLSKVEKAQVYNFIKEQAAGRVPLVAGIGVSYSELINRPSTITKFLILERLL
jgi:4-hydroxy-tetrahydrodipicolinate synthase